ncbi:MAG: division/cell wall cluster transcriptional repressor MraZ [Chloroherpetonaceae bacterium]|nr:division/cell wall cluster transcriptional repressor MraZ [Chloroherpetonaceae bacterium]
MPEFRGTEQYNLNDKGRLMIPARFRRKMISDKPGTPLILVKTPRGNLELYEEVSWKEQKKKLEQLSDFNPEERLLKTFIYANLNEVELDKSGRISLPKRFLEECSITKEVVLIGAENKIELWNPDRLREFLNRPAEDFETLTQRVLG